MQDFRLFISSPGDASVERRRTENVVSRLNGEFGGLARMTAVRWETEAYQAHATFQTQIPPATLCDIVIGILRWRLGTELPDDFDRMPGGERYPSGTAYEILTAIDKRKAGDALPDVFVFRYEGGAPPVVLGEPDEDRKRRDWDALRGFFERWFVTPQGHFIAALNGYRSEDDFERQLETMLRKWLAEKAAGGRAVLWPKSKGSPFRALNAFGARHAPVFFGRASDVRRVMDLWRGRAAAHQRFLLIVGASGAGKSSLARAGIIPRLTTPGVVPDVDRWRIAVTRPGDSRQGPIAALAAALMQTEAELPPDEDGRGPALPEIAEGDSKTPAELAGLLAHADASAVKPILNALTAIGERMRASDRRARAVRCDLVLLIDQLDELFAPSLAPEARDAFATLVAAFVASGRVWVIATLRADLYASMLTIPALKDLKDRGTSYDLAPPGQAELAEIVRAPAAAAGLLFAADPTTGERLDERLLREANRPDMLPLVQLALARLWEARESQGADAVLPCAAFNASGGLKAIVAEAGEGALAKAGETIGAKLAPLIRHLAELSRGQTGTPSVTARAAPLAQAATDPASRALVDLLVEARLLTLADEVGTTSVRLAHQRVLSDWPRAEKIVADSADFYRVRDDVETQRRRWEEGRRRSEGLLRGRSLADARHTAATYAEELSAETHAFIRASRRRAARTQTIGWAMAAVFAVVAVLAGIEAKIAADRQTEADRQKRIAERNFAAAKATVDGLIFNIAQGLRNVVGIRNDTIRAVLETVRKTIDGLIENAPGDTGLLRSRAWMLNNFTRTFLAAGDLKDARSTMEASLVIFRRLAAADASNLGAQRDVSVALNTAGDIKLRAGDQAGALTAYQESLEISRRLAARDTHAQAQRDLSIGLYNVGDVKLQAGDQSGALVAYQESLAILRALLARDTAGAEARDVSVILNKIGDVKLNGADQAGALAAYEEGLAITRTLVAQGPDNALAQRDLAVCLTRVGYAKWQAGDQAGALAAYEEALVVSRRLAAEDQDNVESLRDVLVDLNKIGDVKLRAGDRTGALAAYAEGLAIARRMATQDAGSALAQRDLSISLEKIGDAKLAANDQAGAVAAQEESLAIRRTLASSDKGNAQARRDVSVSLNKLGDVKLKAKDRPGALAAYEQGLVIARALAAPDPSNAQARRDVSFSLNRLGDARLQSGDRPGARAAFEDALAMARQLAADDKANAEAQWDLAVSLVKVASASDAPAPLYAEALALVEALDRDGRLAPGRRFAIQTLRKIVSNPQAPKP